MVYLTSCPVDPDSGVEESCLPAQAVIVHANDFIGIDANALCPFAVGVVALATWRC